MATRTTTSLVDDLDGSTAEETVSFGLERVDYEIDLSADHAGTLREVLARYVAAARRTGGRRAGHGAQSRPSPSTAAPTGSARSRSDNAQIRAWATTHGVTLAERGRIPSQVIEAFDAEDPSRLPPANGVTTAAPADEAPANDTTGKPAPEVESPDEQPRGRDSLTAAEREAARAWAVEQGIEVKPRGQLKKDLVANYRAWQSRQ